MELQESMQGLYNIEESDIKEVKERLSALETSSNFLNIRVDSLGVMVIENPELPARLRSIVENSESRNTESIELLFSYKENHESRLNNVEHKIEEMDKIVSTAFNMKKKNAKNIKKIKETMDNVESNITKSIQEIKEEVKENNREMKIYKEESRIEIKMHNEELQGEMKMHKEELRGEIKVYNEELREEIKIDSEELRGEMRNNKEELEFCLEKSMQTISAQIIHISAKLDSLWEMIDSRLRRLEATQKQDK